MVQDGPYHILACLIFVLQLSMLAWFAKDLTRRDILAT